MPDKRHSGGLLPVFGEPGRGPEGLGYLFSSPRSMKFAHGTL